MSKKIAVNAKMLALAEILGLGGLGYYSYKKLRELRDPAYRLGNLVTDAAKKEREDLKKMTWLASHSRPGDFKDSMGTLV